MFMCCLCTTLVLREHLTTYLRESILVLDPRIASWRFMFLKAYLCSQKLSVKPNFILTNLNKSAKEEKSIAWNVVTAIHLLSRVLK